LTAADLLVVVELVVSKTETAEPAVVVMGQTQVYRQGTHLRESQTLVAAAAAADLLASVSTDCRRPAAAV
jgi:hypothetical protein